MIKMYEISVVPGDGIGKEVIEACIHVLNAMDLDLNYSFADAGDECLEETGTALPDETLELVKKTDACLFGAVGESASEVIIKLRQELNLFANIRPVKSYPGAKAIYDDIDFVIVRENTEGLYSGQEEVFEDRATAKRIITREASERICRHAFEYAKKEGRNKVTAVHKANVLKKTDGLFKKIFYEVAEDYPEIETEDFYIDATAMYLLNKPQSFEVIVTTNLYGDILSDEGAGLVGGLGLLPSGNIGEDNGIFEPVHGSAPTIAGKGIANPAAMILSAAMMLKFLGESEKAENLENAVVETLKNEEKTVDLGGSLSTMEMAEAVVKNL